MKPLYSLRTTELSSFNLLLNKCNLCKPDKKERASGRTSNLLFPRFRDSSLIKRNIKKNVVSKQSNGIIRFKNTYISELTLDV